MNPLHCSNIRSQVREEEEKKEEEGEEEWGKRERKEKELVREWLYCSNILDLKDIREGS